MVIKVFRCHRGHMTGSNNWPSGFRSSGDFGTTVTITPCIPIILRLHIHFSQQSRNDRDCKWQGRTEPVKLQMLPATFKGTGHSKLKFHPLTTHSYVNRSSGDIHRRILEFNRRKENSTQWTPIVTKYGKFP